MRNLKSVYFKDCHSSKTDAAIIRYLETSRGYIDALKRELDEIESSIDPETINRLNSRIESIERLMITVRTDINDIESDIIEFYRDIERIDSDIDDLTQTTTAHGYSITTINNDIVGINDELDYAASIIDEVAERVTALENSDFLDIDALETYLTQFRYITEGECTAIIENYQFQPMLRSGENIKTINNESILGAGNIDIETPTKKYCKGVRNSPATTGTQGTITDLPIEAFEINNSGFIILGGAIKVPNDGIVRIHATIHYAGQNQAIAQGCYIKRNGIEILGSFNFGAGVVDTECYETVNAGDLISFAARASAVSRGIDYKSGSGYKNTYLYIEYI